jgi:hypothetical protein
VQRQDPKADARIDDHEKSMGIWLREALNQLSKVAPAIAQRVFDLRQIIGFRNILIHGYAAIDHGRV